MPEVSIVLSGMSTEEQIADNLAYAARSSAGMFSEEDNKVIEKVQGIFASYDTIPCTGCSYCLPCPTDGNFEAEKKRYEEWIPMFGQKASGCIACHKCEEVCPQHIKIADKLKEVAAVFEK